jgi:transposase
MIQISAQTRILVAVEPVDFRCGIDALAALCRQRLKADPFCGTLFVFRNRKGSAMRVLAYDSQGFWLCHKRLSSGRFRFWPSAAGAPGRTLEATELQVLLMGGDPAATRVAPAWRPLKLAA